MKCPNCGSTAQVRETENGFTCGCGHEWVYCPCNGWDCPYWKDNGTCSLVDEGATLLRNVRIFSKKYLTNHQKCGII